MATLGGNITINGNLLLWGGYVEPGNDGTAGLISANADTHVTGTITFEGTNYLHFDLGKPASSGGVAGTDFDQIKAAGTLMNSGNPILYVTLNALTNYGSGTYPLITGASGGTFAPSNVYLTNVTGGVFNGCRVVVSTSATGLTLTATGGQNFLYAGATSNPNVYWTTGSTWSYTGSSGWSPGQLATDTVEFTAAALAGTGYGNSWYGDYLASNVSVASLAIDSGPTARLQIGGTGTLTVGGGTGTITVPSGGNLYTSTTAYISANVSLTGGVLGWAGFGGYPYQGTGTVTATSGTSILGPVSQTGSLVVNSGATLKVGDATSVTYGGLGVYYGPTVSFTAGATVNAGGMLTSGSTTTASTMSNVVTVAGQLGGTLTIGGNVTSTGGTITPGETVLGTKAGAVGLITISGSNTLTLNSATNLCFDLRRHDHAWDDI